MTPGARVAAAIEVLDQIAAGAATEQALTNWARRSRYAGSKDRAAVRDHVFDVIRNKASDACRGGGSSGRALMLGRLRAEGLNPDDVFDGQGHSPAPLSPEERSQGSTPTTESDIWNLPEWLVAAFRTSLGETAEATALALQHRAPITLRVNLAKATLDTATDALAKAGVEVKRNPVASTALTVTAGTRQLRGSAAYKDGLVELQDAASQAAVAALGEGQLHVLDYCAGGGGKALGLAALGHRVTAHDANPTRMRDLPQRAARAGVDIAVKAPEDLSSSNCFDVVFCDAPCSGSGSWRRSPDGKWALTSEDLNALLETQASILDHAQSLVSPEGRLMYATCSVLRSENEAQIAAFLEKHPQWRLAEQTRISVSDASDGFFHATVKRVG